MTFAGQWGSGRRTMASAKPRLGAQTGGMNARGSTKTYSTTANKSQYGTSPLGELAEATQSFDPKQAAKNQKKIQNRKSKASAAAGVDKWKDAGYRRNLAELKFEMGKSKAEKTRNLQQLAGQFAAQTGQIGRQSEQAKQQLGSQMGSSGFGRSGVLGVGAGQIEQERARQLAQATSQYGKYAQGFEKSLFNLAQTRFEKAKEAEIAGARERDKIRSGELL